MLFAAALSCAQSTTSPTGLQPASARITDEAIAADLAVFKTWQERADAIAKETPSTDAPRRYLVAKANAWLAFAREEYWANDRGTVVEESLAEAIRLIDLLNTTPEPSVEGRTRLISETRAVQPDIWQEVERFKSHPRFDLVPDEVARLEIELLRAGHDQADGAACSAEPHEQEVSKLANYVDSVLTAAPEPEPEPEPVVPLPPEVIPDRDGDGVPDPLDCCPNTPQGKLVDGRGCPEPEMETQTVLEGVEFATDKFRLRVASRRILDSVVVELLRRPSVPVEVSGHTDWVASDEYNVTLSANRARAVRQYLVDHGVAADRITAAGYGESRPRDTNETSEGRQRNRRVELTWKLPVQLDLLPACVEPSARPDGTPTESQTIRAVWLDDVLFPVASIAILDAGRHRLNALAREVRSLDGFELVLEGHADEAGDPESNLALSLARAHKVRAYLVELGLPGDRIIVGGFGAQYPRSEGGTEQSRARNRRVELWLRPALP